MTSISVDLGEFSSEIENVTKCLEEINSLKNGMNDKLFDSKDGNFAKELGSLDELNARLRNTQGELGAHFWNNVQLHLEDVKGDN